MTVARPPLGLVVPVYDEAERLADYAKLLVDFVAELPAGSALLFVDDGSTDGTPDLIDDVVADTPGVPARVLRRPHLGKGAAITAGLRALRTNLVGFCDLDLSTPLDDLDGIARAAARSGGLAIGSRGLATSTLVRREGPVRESLGRVYNRLLQAVMTPGVVDTQWGVKRGAPRWRRGPSGTCCYPTVGRLATRGMPRWSPSHRRWASPWSRSPSTGGTTTGPR
jgi:dolichyl-phosphate beta-glucosyltransferase